MPKVDVHAFLRLALVPVVAGVFAVAPQFAQAQTIGSLTQLGGSNSCIAVGESECPTANGEGLSGSEDVAVSPDGKNVYVLGENDDAIAEFSRSADGSLTQIGCIADIDARGSCSSTSADGLVAPDAILMSGNNLYVAGRDDDENYDIAEFTRNSDGSLTELGCIAQNSETSNCPAHSASGLLNSLVALAISPHGDNLYAADENGEAIAEFGVNSDGTLTQLTGANACIQQTGFDSGECSSSANGISEVTGIVVSPDGSNVYTSGFSGGAELGTIAELSRNSDGSLSQASSTDCIEDPALDEGCGSTAVGIDGMSRPVISG